ncbi:MAG: acetolactate synthase small subunit [Paracoccaceae bacterium]|jgi:acetolactate synthase-1/3 small subunit|nr:acetolactate synthase small subunit [Marinovum sp.]PDH58589.1 MAG: acetolactate synthase small subunit [Rhodobacteraceae bacterium MED-G07]|tara:strand:- start:163 stop:720 length:558 start_codon:yes stop_codon:yes gene_type:complete
MSALKIKKGSSKHSAYDLRSSFGDEIQTHTLTILVDNEAGVLARVIGLFSGRGYNIDSLTVAEVDHEGHLSRITIVTTGTPQVIEQIKAQLGRIVPVHEVHDLTVEGPHVERELALLKVGGKGEKRLEALRLADIFRANVVDSTLDNFTFQITGAPEKVDAFAELMRPLGLIEIARTGVAALSRG